MKLAALLTGGFGIIKVSEQRDFEILDACRFDEEQRQADLDGPGRRGLLVGQSFIHRQMVPLRMVDLDGDGEKGGGCGTLFDGQDAAQDGYRRGIRGVDALERQAAAAEGPSPGVGCVRSVV